MVVVLYELLVWICVLIVGIQYIFTIEDVADIVQGAVALGFINGLDNMAVFVHGTSVERLTTDYFRCNYGIQDRFGTRHESCSEEVVVSDIVTPVLIAISFGIVYISSVILC